MEKIQFFKNNNVEKEQRIKIDWKFLYFFLYFLKYETCTYEPLGFSTYYAAVHSIDLYMRFLSFPSVKLCCLFFLFCFLKCQMWNWIGDVWKNWLYINLFQVKIQLLKIWNLIFSRNSSGFTLEISLEFQSYWVNF